MSELGAKLFVGLQRILPKYLLTALFRRIARIRHEASKNFLIDRFVRLYGVDTAETAGTVPEDFACFNDFFIRELEPGARVVDEAADSIVSPVDGTVSAAGRIEAERLIQAKGVGYSLKDLLATDLADSERFADGAFATFYLAPYNYHRIHAPLAGELAALRYVPGKLFSVNAATVRHLPGLFAKNERLVCHLATRRGPMVLVFVGAMNVGTISTVWTGDIRPRKSGLVEEIDLKSLAVQPGFDKGDLLGWFNFGSTVIVVAPPGLVDDFAGLEPGQTVQMGQVIGRLSDRQ